MKCFMVSSTFLIFQVFINELFECLFSLPSPVKRYLPKCKSQSSRSGAYDLQIELVKGNMENYKVLHAKMLHQHSKGKDFWLPCLCPHTRVEEEWIPLALVLALV